MTEPTDDSPHKQSRIGLKPVIKEIVRTRFFGKPIELLVERIHVVPYRCEDEDDEEEESEAYRLWLSDGQKTIQAVLKPEIHPFVTSRDIRDGSVVLLTRYELRQAKRLNGEGHVLYLVIEDMESVDHDGRDSVPFTFEPARSTQGTSGASSESTVFPGLKSSDETSTKAAAAAADETPRDEGPLGRKRALDETSPSPTPSKPKATRVSFEAARGRRDNVLFTRPKTSSGPTARPFSGHSSLFSRPRTQPSPEAKRRAAGPDATTAIDTTTSTQQHDAPQPITRPLTLVPLSQITGPPSSVQRNKIVDVLAVIASVAPSVTQRAQRPHLDLPPSRDLRVVDPSTSKKVQLTVFVGAEDFVPAVGTVALFRSVTTHEWDGGSLKAYPRDCRGKEWFVPWPWAVEGCDVKAMKNWWEARALAGL